MRKIFGNSLFVRDIDKNDVKEMFKIIDSVFFDNELQKMIHKNKIKMLFSVSEKLTSSAGYCRLYNDNRCKITLSLPIIRKLFIDKNMISPDLKYRLVE